MINMKGKTVKDSNGICGVITAFSEERNRFGVKFENGFMNSYVYPDAFRNNVLTTDDSDLKAAIDEMLMSANGQIITVKINNTLLKGQHDLKGKVSVSENPEHVTYLKKRCKLRE